MAPGTDRRERDRAGAEFARAVGGDPAAFAAFLARFERRIARVVRAIVPSREAEDVFQEVCLRLLLKGRLYDRTRPFVPWLDAVTRQVCLTALRRLSRRRERAGEVPERAAPASGATDPWIRDAVHGYLSERSSAEREALMLVLLSGLSQREAAKRLGVPPGTVATWLAKAVRTLRERLGGGT